MTANTSSPRTWVISFYDPMRGADFARRIDNVSATDLADHVALAADDIASDDIYSIIEVESSALVVIDGGTVLASDLEKF